MRGLEIHCSVNISKKPGAHLLSPSAEEIDDSWARESPTFSKKMKTKKGKVEWPELFAVGRSPW